MKKLLYSVVVLAMALGLGGTAFGAAGDIAPKPWTDLAGHEAEADLTLMAALGIFTGDIGLGGAVKPDDPITRAQFCKVVVTALDKASTAAGLAGLQPTFADGASIPTWAWGFVNVASYMGIINGYADGSFGPNQPVTYAEAVTMLVRAVPGHVAQVPAGIWPYNYLFYGVDAGFTGSVDVGFASLPCTRGDMAGLLFATMQVNHLFTTGDNAGTEKEDSAILVEGENLFSDAGGGYLFDADTFVSHEYGDLPLGDPVYLVGAANFDELYFQPFQAVTVDDKVVFIHQTEGEGSTGTFKGWDEDSATGDYSVVFADGTKVPCADGNPDFPMILNQDFMHVGLELLPGDELILNLDDTGAIISATALRYDLVYWDSADYGEFGPVDVYGWDYVSAVTPSDAKAETPAIVTFSGDNGPFEFYDAALDPVFFEPYGYTELDNSYDFNIPATARVTINGAPAKPDDLKEGDLLKVATFGGWGYDASDADFADIIAVSATRKVVEGTVSGSRTVFPGDILYVTLKAADGTVKEYRVGEYAYEIGLAGKHQYLVGEDGYLFFDASYEANVFCAVVMGASTETGTETKYFVTVDNRGVEQTCQVAGDESAHVGEPMLVSIDGASGQATLQSYNDYWGEATVVAIGSDSVTLDWGGGDYEFLETTVVYSDPDGFSSVWSDNGVDDGKFIGLAGLSVGDKVTRVGFQPADEWFYMLLRDDTPTD